MKKILIFVSIISIAVANDMTDIENLINKQWKANSTKNWKEYVSMNIPDVKEIIKEWKMNI